MLSSHDVLRVAVATGLHPRTVRRVLARVPTVKASSRTLVLAALRRLKLGHRPVYVDPGRQWLGFTTLEKFIAADSKEIPHG
jgi:hypothetical protein